MVEVFAAQEGVAIGGQHFKLFVAIHIGDFDNGNIKCAAAQVVHGDFAVAFGIFVHAEGQRRRSRLVDDAFYFQAGDFTGVFGGLTLAVVEVGRHGNHRFGNRLAQVVFGGFFHFAQNFGRHLRRRQFFALGFHPRIAIGRFHNVERHGFDVFLYFFVFKFAANQAFYRINGVFSVGNRLALGGRAHQDFAAVQIGNHGRGGACAFGVFDYFGLAAFRDGQTGIGGTQINTDDFCHDKNLLIQYFKIRFMVLLNSRCGRCRVFLAL